MGAAAEQIVELGTAPVATGGLRDRLAPLRSNALAMFGAVVTGLFVLTGIIGAAVVLVPSLQHLYLDQNLAHALQKPFTPGHVLGTDNFGRDIGWRIVAGTGISLLVGVAVTSISIVLGMALGTLAGYFGGRFDTLISGIIDLTWGFPLLLVAAIVVGSVGPGLTAVIVAVGLVNWAGFARIIRAETISLRQREFIEAARALGVSDVRMILRHIVPNTIGSTLVMSSYYIAQTVIVEAGLAFIGLGAQPPTPSLGQMISSGRSYLYVNPWMAIVPGIVIALIVLGLNTLGDGLRDVFDPRTRRSA